MIPEISTSVQSGVFIPPYNIAKNPLSDVVRGGVAMFDASQGLNVQDWTATADGEVISVRSESGQEHEVFTASGRIEWLSLAFDQAMHPVYCFTVSGQSYLRFWNVQDGVENEIALGEVFTPFARMDDVIRVYITHNDVIVSYLKTDGLYFRCERERYGTEHKLQDGEYSAIEKTGMNDKRRLQWQIKPKAPVFIEDVCAIVWKDRMYRLRVNDGGIGYLCIYKSEEESVILVDKIAITHGVSVENSRLGYSWDNLIICTNNHLYYYNADDGLREVTDQSLGDVKDAIFIDGYTMTTDGEYMIVTELNDPMAINPLKYGSSEADPDPILQLHNVRGEVYALNRYTIEVFQNVGGDNYPFQRVDGALCMKGVYNHGASTVVGEQLVFVGSGRGEALGFYTYNNGVATKLSTNDVDRWLDIRKGKPFHVEQRVFSGHKFVYIHSQKQNRVKDGETEELRAATIVIDIAASEEMQRPVWFELTSQKPREAGNSSVIDLTGFNNPDRHHSYMFHNFTEFDGRWVVATTKGYNGDPSALFFMDETRTNIFFGNRPYSVAECYAQEQWWEFTTPMNFLEGNGAIVNELELVGVVGEAVKERHLGYDVICDTNIYTQYSKDGMTWSNPRFVGIEPPGFPRKRLAFFNNGFLRNWRIQKFTGNSNVRITINRLQADMEVLNA